jgi:hypothetical protein
MVNLGLASPLTLPLFDMTVVCATILATSYYSQLLFHTAVVIVAPPTTYHTKEPRNMCDFLRGI